MVVCSVFTFRYVNGSTILCVAVGRPGKGLCWFPAGHFRDPCRGRCIGGTLDTVRAYVSVLFGIDLYLCAKTHLGSLVKDTNIAVLYH